MAKAKPAWSYETAIAEVEQVVQQLESGELPLAEVLEQFQQASQRLQQCDRFLRDKQAELDLLIESLDEPSEPPQ
ncbi:exodeoxyribonuclease VII small subunit [Synechococcus elongatus]|uniref:Exodeoxyribonuclease 7 small subunit n=1 Tax=Synechococcus elongatus PCC 11801 TaxID=2219813 RepID=A0AAN1UTG8_SYNEL|nr:exodeoxyribonuclease VII small subunit [Synechococcus elongatus]AZB71524.1 exodeoxyribonuclease VII small subunit [Synechococcus elongatus PCC 11801]